MDDVKENKRYWIMKEYALDHSGFGGLEVSVLASGTRLRGFKPGRKNPQHAFLRRGSKAVGPMS